MKNKHNTIIDKEAMHDLMVRLTEEGIEWKLINDRVVVKAYHVFGTSTFEIVMFKNRINTEYPWILHWVGDNREYKFKNIDNIIDWIYALSIDWISRMEL